MSSKLDELIPEYGVVKEEADKYKKIQDNLNAEIKDTMRNLSDSKYEVDGWVASFSVITQENFDMDKLIYLFQSPDFEEVAKEYGIVEMIPSINMNALENAIYDMRIDPNTLNTCKITKSYERLVVKRKAKNESKGEVFTRRSANRNI